MVWYRKSTGLWKPNDIVIVHDHNYLYAIYYLHYHRQTLSQFTKHYLIGTDEKYASKIPKVSLLDSDEFEKTMKGYQHLWLRKLKVKIVSHLTAEAKALFESHSESALSKTFDLHYYDMGIDERLTVQAVRRSRRWRIANGIQKNDMVIAVFGSVTSNKLLVQITSAVLAVCLKNEKPEARLFFLVAGAVRCHATFIKIKSCFESKGLASCLIYQNPEDEMNFDALILAADIVFVCRKQNRGQLSHIIPRALCLGSLILTNQSSGFSMISDEFILPDDNFEDNAMRKIESILDGQIDVQSEKIKNRELYVSRFNISEMIRNFLLPVG